MGLEALLEKLEARSITSVSAYVTNDVTAKPAETLPCTSVTPVTAENIIIGENRVAQLDHTKIPPLRWNGDVPEEEFEYRAAIIEQEAGIPREWAEAFARVCLMPPPANISRQGWQRIVDNTGRLLDNKNHLHDMVRYGWSIEDIFACHPVTPEVRPEMKGLLLLLDKGEIIAIINDKSIGLKCQSGSMLHYRKPLNPSAERCMIWELPNMEARPTANRILG